jgi:hypothetical protein
MKLALIVADFLNGPGYHSYTDLCSILNVSRKQAYRWMESVKVLTAVQTSHIHCKEFVFRINIEGVQQPTEALNLRENGKTITLLKAIHLRRFLLDGAWHSYPELEIALDVRRRQALRWIWAIEASGVPVEFERRAQQVWFRQMFWAKH